MTVVSLQFGLVRTIYNTISECTTDSVVPAYVSQTKQNKTKKATAKLYCIHSFWCMPEWRPL